MVTINNNYVHHTPQSKRIHMANDRDYISNLPESLISHILSCMPTKDAVRTSVLSRDWEFMWTCLSCIDVSDKSSSLRGKDRTARFVRFVNRIVMFSDKSRIKKFRLQYSWSKNSDFIETWVTALLLRSVQYLDVKATRIPSIASSRCFSGWISLTELKLELSCTLNVFIMNSFSNLKSLLLSGVDPGIKIKNEQISNSSRISMIFPVLEVVELINCIWFDIDYVKIQAPELTSFKTFWFLIDQKQGDWEINIVGAKLETFESHNGVINSFVLSAPLVTRTALRHAISDVLARRAYAILNGFQNLKCLNLSGGVIQALVRSNLIRALSNLDQVKEVGVCGDWGPNNNVLQLLQILPSLESVDINMCFSDENAQAGDPLLPCIMPNLKRLKYTSLQGITGELKLAESILKYAENVETVFVSTCKRRRQISQLVSKLIPMVFWVCSHDIVPKSLFWKKKPIFFLFRRHLP